MASSGEIPSDLSEAELTWRMDLDNPFLYRLDDRERDICLRVNDFPEELMFSLLVDGEIVAEFDDEPAGWVLSRRYQ